MKKVILILIILAALFLFLQTPVYASNLQDSLVPQDGGRKQVGEVQLEYNRYPLDRYQLDTYVDTSGDWLPWRWAEASLHRPYGAGQFALAAEQHALLFHNGHRPVGVQTGLRF